MAQIEALARRTGCRLRGGPQRLRLVRTLASTRRGRRWSPSSPSWSPASSPSTGTRSPAPRAAPTPTTEIPRERPVQGHRPGHRPHPGLRHRHRHRAVHRAHAHARHAVHAHAAQPASARADQVDRHDGSREAPGRSQDPAPRQPARGVQGRQARRRPARLACSSPRRCSRSARRSPSSPPTASTSPTRRCALIKVEYEVLPGRAGLPGGDEAVDAQAVGQQPRRHRPSRVTAPLVRGDPTRPSAEVVVENVVDQGHRAARRARDDQLAVLVGQRQAEHDLHQPARARHARRGLSQALKLPQNKVRVVAAGLRRLGLRLPQRYRPVRDPRRDRWPSSPADRSRTCTRAYEDFVTRTHRPQFRNEMKIGVQPGRHDQFGAVQDHRRTSARSAPRAASGAWYHLAAYRTRSRT